MRLCPGCPLPARTGNAPLGSHGDPKEEGWQLRGLSTPQEVSTALVTPEDALGITTPALGHLLGHVPALKGSQPCKYN